MGADQPVSITYEGQRVRADPSMLRAMQAMKLGTSGGLERLKLVELPDPQGPGAGEIQVRIQGSSLNFHDYAVARFDAPYTAGRIPLADGAGVVEAVGPGVTE